MRRIGRRGFLGASVLAASASAAAEPQEKPASLPATAPPGEVTRDLARFIVESPHEAIPPAARKEATRTLLNWTGCAIGGSRQSAVASAVAAFHPFSGPPQAGLLGRSERFDILHAALINGIAAHVLDFDDTHLRTIIHPAAPVSPALLALAEYRSAAGHPVNGKDFLHALILGIEVECRIGNAVYPAHYDAGWHITGTTGVFGAAAAAGKLLGLTELQMTWALGLAAVQPVGLREMFGSMTKSFHPGRAAQNGLTAALLAQRDFTSSEHGIEAKNGWANVLSTARDYTEISGKPSAPWQVSLNTYKPFACGIVMHPAIDGCIQLSRDNALKPEQIASIELRVNRLVPELTGKKSPETGLDGKFSIYHAVAVAIVERAGGEQQFSDRAVRNPATVALRQRVTATVDPKIAEDQVRIQVVLKDGRKLDKYIEHAVGSLTNPMTDRDLEGKFSGLAEGILPKDQSRRVMDLCWKIADLPDAADITRSAAAL
jgi:2-methylcitrate dehydratase PrpD